MQAVGTRSTSRRARLFVPGFLTLGLVLFAAPAARADDIANVFQEYQQSGTINACKHSPGALGGGVGNDLEQYASDFVDALRAAQLAHSRCGGSSSSSGSSDNGSAAALAAGAGKPPPRPPGGGKPRGSGRAVGLTGGAGFAAPVVATSLKGGHGGGTPGPIVILAILAGLILLVSLPLLVWRYLGFGFDGLAPVRHVFGEGALRMRTAAGGLADWLRLDALRRTA
jgi:hypothetical protein